MSKKISIDLEDAIYALGLFACLILFWGEPDLMDRIIYGELDRECIVKEHKEGE